MFQRPTLLFLTDLSNESEEEDIIISNYLRNYFEVIICHPDDCQSLEDQVKGIIIRNTWNESKYGNIDWSYYERFRNKKLKVYDSLYVKEGESKDYLVEMYKKGYPVIPSVNSKKNIHELPETRHYFIKPQEGFSSIGSKKVSKEELITLSLEHYIAQPFIDFVHEVSFYYIDKEYQHTLYAPDKTERWSLAPFEPSSSDRTFADLFIKSSKQKQGIERIDACRLKTGELLLVEITDQGGVCLSIPKLPEDMRERFLKNLARSIHKNLFEKEFSEYKFPL